MSIFQVLAVLFALMMMYIVSIHRKKAMLSKAEVSFWLSSWLVFCVVALFPHWLQGITGFMKFARVFDLLVVVSLMFITFLVVVNYLMLKENAKKLEELVRHRAIDRTHEKNQK